jgi:two-component system chemotaxis sensor kinase CheA
MTKENLNMDFARQLEANNRTIDVLKNKVIAIYNGDAQLSFQKQLEGAKKREEETRRKRELMEMRNAELKKYSESLEAQIKARTRDLKVILDNVSFGFLVIDKNLAVCGECTQSCHVLFGADKIKGVHFPSLLRMSKRDQEMYALLVDQVFEDLITEELSVSQLPQRFELSGGRILKVEPSALRDAEGNVHEILLTVSDMTDFERVQRENIRNRILIGILKQKDAFRQFVNDVRQQLESATQALTQNDMSKVRRAIHTIKGNAAAYELENLVASIHHIEELPELQPKNIKQIEAALVSFLKENESVLEIQYDGSSQMAFEVSVKEMKDLKSLISTVGGNQIHDLHTWTAKVTQKPAGAMMGPVQEFVTKLSERLGKKVDFRLTGADTLVDCYTMWPVFQNLVHLVRNAIDHGIENPELRGKKGETGNFSIDIADRGNFHEVVITDDGRGISVDVISAKAITKGLVTKAQVEAMTVQQKLELIFLDGLSSAEKTTEISGRGVGMSAVKESVEQCRGKITIWSEIGKGTKFTLTMPKNDAHAQLENIKRVA